VKVSSIPTITANSELWVKIPVSKIASLFTMGTPNDYVVTNPQRPGSGKWIHHFGSIVPYSGSPTTTVVAVDDG
jgi:hypothetical protein